MQVSGPYGPPLGSRRLAASWFSWAVWLRTAGVTQTWSFGLASRHTNPWMQVSGPYGSGSAAAIAAEPRAPRAVSISTESRASVERSAKLRFIVHPPWDAPTRGTCQLGFRREGYPRCQMTVATFRR